MDNAAEGRGRMQRVKGESDMRRGRREPRRTGKLTQCNGRLGFGNKRERSDDGTSHGDGGEIGEKLGGGGEGATDGREEGAHKWVWIASLLFFTVSCTLVWENESDGDGNHKLAPFPFERAWFCVLS